MSKETLIFNLIIRLRKKFYNLIQSLPGKRSSIASLSFIFKHEPFQNFGPLQNRGASSKVRSLNIPRSISALSTTQAMTQNRPFFSLFLFAFFIFTKILLNFALKNAFYSNHFEDNSHTVKFQSTQRAEFRFIFSKLIKYSENKRQ